MPAIVHYATCQDDRTGVGTYEAAGVSWPPTAVQLQDAVDSILDLHPAGTGIVVTGVTPLASGVTSAEGDTPAESILRRMLDTRLLYQTNSGLRFAGKAEALALSTSERALLARLCRPAEGAAEQDRT